MKLIIQERYDSDLGYFYDYYMGEKKVFTYHKYSYSGFVDFYKSTILSHLDFYIESCTIFRNNFPFKRKIFFELPSPYSWDSIKVLNIPLSVRYDIYKDIIKKELK